MRDGIRGVKITLTPSDTYRVEFYAWRTLQGGLSGFAVVGDFDDIYCDQLRDVFDRATGLATSL